MNIMTTDQNQLALAVDLEFKRLGLATLPAIHVEERGVIYRFASDLDRLAAFVLLDPLSACWLPTRTTDDPIFGVGESYCLYVLPTELVWVLEQLRLMRPFA